MDKKHKEQSQLKRELEQGQTQVEVGAGYHHYKTKNKSYTVVGLAFLEDNDQICVIYRAEYGERITFIRPLISWLQMVEWNGETVPRFTKI